MSKTETQVIGHGFPTASILTILFVVLKVFGYIQWSWWWVFAPLWISTGLVLAFIVLVLGGALLVAILE